LERGGGPGKKYWVKPPNISGQATLKVSYLKRLSEGKRFKGDWGRSRGV